MDKQLQSNENFDFDVVIRIICVWSLLCSVRIYKTQHFIIIFLEN